MHTAKQVIKAAIEAGLIENYAHGYAEPGYSDPKAGVLFANWNDKTEYDAATNTRTTVDRTMSRLGKVAERAGYECEWSDEWYTCEDCGKAVRSSADSYSWQPSYAWINACIVCHECVDPVEYLESLEGEDNKAVTLDVYPIDHGYVLVKEGMEHGWHPGQNDSPTVVAADLRSRGIERFLFKVDSVGQFDLDFSVYVHESEAARLTGEPKSSLPYDPGTEMGKALRGEPSDHYRMTTREITAEEFVSGSWCKDR